mmetsp:Transcript_22309/g.52570  ORF Transcript_22309/g.52570 Transcript_22309/m.52570 type:complete len:225 (+) Transcript_22309:246-920(+)
MTASETIEFHELLGETCERGCQSLDDVRAEIRQHCEDDANDHDHSNHLPESFLQLVLRHVKQEGAQYFLEQLSVLRSSGLVQLEEGHPSAVSPHELLELVRPECLIPAHLSFHIGLQGLPDVQRSGLPRRDLFRAKASELAGILERASLPLLPCLACLCRCLLLGHNRCPQGYRAARSRWRTRPCNEVQGRSQRQERESPGKGDGKGRAPCCRHDCQGRAQSLL